MNHIRIFTAVVVAALVLATPDGALAQTDAPAQTGARAQTATSAPSTSPAQGARAARTYITLDELKAQLAREERTLAEATHDELARLAPSGGSLIDNLTNDEYVARIGLSTFILDLRMILAVIGTAALVVLLFFTPMGFMLTRGRLHAALGGILSASGIAPDFGRHLAEEPARWLREASGARRAFGLYMHNAFIPAYKNNITAIAFVGTAFLILNIGLRGIKFMTAHQPDMIIIAIVIEMTVLCLLGMTTWYEKQMEVAEARATAPADAALFDTDKWILREEAVRMIDKVKEDIEASWREEYARRIGRSAAA